MRKVTLIYGEGNTPDVYYRFVPRRFLPGEKLINRREISIRLPRRRFNLDNARYPDKGNLTSLKLALHANLRSRTFRSIRVSLDFSQVRISSTVTANAEATAAVRNPRKNS